MKPAMFLMLLSRLPSLPMFVTLRGRCFHSQQGLTNEKSISTGEVFSLSSALVEPDTPIHASGELSEWKAYPYQYSCLGFHPGIDFVHLPTRPAGLPFPPRTWFPVFLGLHPLVHGLAKRADEMNWFRGMPSNKGSCGKSFRTRR